MSKWLASVQSLEEAQTLLPILPDILDMKNPSQGALGALTVNTVSQIVKLIAGRCHTSATIGDLPMRADLINTAMIKMASSGVDYIKVGLLTDDNLTNCIIGLANTIKKLRTPVIAVFFADKTSDVSALLPLLKASGFYGVMIDTAIKNGQHLQDHWDLLQLARFVKAVHQHNMICGLAGALRYEDIQQMRPLDADYLGFRSALCERRQRTSELKLKFAEQIHQAIKAKTVVAG
ncbi:MAG: (5-formylfuran-3-yl)methyl phosphate synthase [Gammaproteobacteria bacterium]|nr:(5-formylfuran-3-yl)methyl phosphate synthase [Gammaproteobacteria bacterium]MDH5592135.1 (5-formylfuran-3-yl)methyl phosphate synthase [Gammaproteobacteria bacterium]